MAKLSDTIEEFIISLLDACDNSVDIRRNELAEYFGCVPSQINYVIATRFTVDKGFSVESKKGGKGYVRIMKHDVGNDDFMAYLLKERIGSSISFRECEDIVFRLTELDYITAREKDIILSALKDIPLPVNLEFKSIIRAHIFKNILLSILKNEEDR